jgi:hypothetical protein
MKARLLNFPLEHLVVMLNGLLFVHRENADGTIVSFCRKCFMTVATSQWEANLDSAERIHKCDPIQLEYLDGILSQTSK